MNCRHLGIVVLSLAGACAMWEHGFSAQGADETAGHGLLADTPDVRKRSLQDSLKQYQALKDDARAALTEAEVKHRPNERYMSPLHAAILAVEGLRAFEAEGTLLSIIDYELDVRSFPSGLNVGGDAFYPAARALVRLRVEPAKLLDAIGDAKSDRQVQLLTWVLLQRSGSAEDARQILREYDKMPQVAKAIRLLEHPDSLLPSPRAR